MPRYGQNVRASRRFASPASAATETTRNFWGGGIDIGGGRTFWMVQKPWRFPPELCQEMIEQVMEAMSKALASGVVEYRVGSRSLRRFTMKELQDFLLFWTNQLEASIMGGSIVARRAAPCDV